MTNKINVYLLLIFPFSFVSGPLIPEIITILIIINSLAKNRENIFQKKIFNFIEIKLITIFAIIIFLESFFSIDYYLSFKNTLFYFRFIFLFIIIKYVLTEKKDFLKKLYFLLICFLSFLCFDLFFQFFFGENLFGMKTIYNNNSRFSGLFGDEYIMGGYLLKMLPILTFITFLIKKELPKYIFAASILCHSLIYASIYISGERASLFLLFFFLILTTLANKKLLQFNVKTFFIFIPFLILLFVFNQNLFKRHFITTINQINNFKDVSIFTEINSKKKNHIYNSLYNSSIISFKENILIGSGPNTFRKSCEKNINLYPKLIKNCSTHPHNFYFQLLSETGIIGSIAIIFFYLYFVKIYIWNLVGKKNIEVYSIPLIVGILVNFFPFTPNGNFFNNWLTYMIFFPVPFILYLKEKNKLYK